MFFGIAIGYTQFSFAQYTGNDLLRDCNALIAAGDGEAADSLSIGRCMGFMDGALQAIAMLDTVGGVETICPPENVPGIQFARIAVKWMKANPEELHEAAFTFLMLPIVEAFPCE